MWVSDTCSPSTSRIRLPLGFLSARNSSREIAEPSRSPVRLLFAGFFAATAIRLQVHSSTYGLERSGRVGRSLRLQYWLVRNFTQRHEGGSKAQSETLSLPFRI